VQHQDEAIAQWREVLKLSPGDVKAAEGIGRVLVYTKRYKEAATFLVEQEKAGNSSAEMELQLGKAYMASGEAEKGMEQFHKAIESQRTSGALNAAAYAMAEANYELPEALAYAKECVEKIEQESTETTAGDLREPWTTVSLAAEWDTLGWVKFRMGDLGGAQKYLEAAWRLMQSPEGGEHVGELYEKIGKKQQALEQYSMALNALGLKGDGDLRQRLTEKIATLKAGGATKKGDAGGELSALRSYKLELPKGWSGYGMGAVRLELVNGAPVRVSASFVSGSEELRKYAPTLEKANFRIVFPDERAAKIAVMGTLSCSEASRACTLVLQPVGEPWTRPAVPSPATPAS
jgi:tetratricopeptide (TPR) repeat protein